MKIAIIGGGVTGLTAAYELTKRGHQVTLFEKEKSLGGLAQGFKEPNWDWYLESAYHHLFANDNTIIGLIKELGLGGKLIIKRPITANFWRSRAYQFDNPKDFLLYPGLAPVDKIRTATLLSFLKLNPFWQPLEGITTKSLITAVGGQATWQKLWEPLMVGKFNYLADTVAASWFWARIKKRTPKLAYIEGGFQTLVVALEKAIRKHGGIIQTNAAVVSIANIKYQISNLQIKYQIGKNKEKHGTFDRVLVTVPTPIAIKLVPQFKISNFKFQIDIPHLHAQNLILETKEPILKNACPERSRGVYWLNILDRSFPFLAVVAHTNFMDKKNYGGHHLTYFGNYLPDGHPFLSMSKKQLFKLFLPYIQRLNPAFDLQPTTYNLQLFIGAFAQPVHQLHYSKLAPPLRTPVDGIYLANLDSIYPWDRGTNYAVELGQRAAKKIDASCTGFPRTRE